MHIRLLCAHCGIAFSRLVSQKGKSDHAYCSRPCYLAAQHPLPLDTRFWSYVERGNQESCWPWLGAIDRRGYGVFSIAVGKNDHRINKRAHRIAHELTYGPLLPGFQINHHCHLPRCCNPSHGYVGTQQENVRDMILAGHHLLVKLTHAAISEIRMSSLSANKLATMYKVHAKTIRKIRHRQNWNHRA